MNRAATAERKKQIQKKRKVKSKEKIKKRKKNRSKYQKELEKKEEHQIQAPKVSETHKLQDFRVQKIKTETKGSEHNLTSKNVTKIMRFKRSKR